MAKQKVRIEEFPELGEICISSKKELQNLLKNNSLIEDTLGLCFTSGSSIPVRGIDFRHGDSVTINLGKYNWITLRRVA